MKQLLARVARLESRVTAPGVPPVRYGYLTALPDDYTGDRHVVIVSRTPQSDGSDWCEFAERPGLAPPQEEDRAFSVPALEICWPAVAGATEEAEATRAPQGSRPLPHSSIQG
jgi:hypothetical protein